MPIQLHAKQTIDEAYTLGGDDPPPVFTFGPLSGAESSAINFKAPFADDTPIGVGAGLRRELIVLGLRGWSGLKGYGHDGQPEDIPWPGDAAKAFDIIANDWKLVSWLSMRIFALNAVTRDELKN